MAEAEQHPDAKLDGRDETPSERADRNFTELLQELRCEVTKSEARLNAP